MSDRAPFLGAAVAAALVLLPAGAHAQRADKVEARRHFDIGVADAKAGAYREAVVEFQRAYELSPNFAVLYNLATAEAALGDPAGALATYERYLAEGGAKVPPERRAKVAAEMKQLVPRTGSILPHLSPEGVRASLDGVAIDSTALARGLRVNVGQHKLAATAEGHLPVERTVTVGSGDTLNVTLALAPVPSPAADLPLAPPPAPPEPIALPPPAPPSPSAPALVAERPSSPIAGERSTGTVQRVVGYAVGAAGLVALGTGGVLYLVARSNADKAIAAHCTQDLTTCTGDGKKNWDDAQAGVKNSRIAAAVGGLLLVGGVGLVVMAPSSSGGPAGVALAGRW